MFGVLGDALPNSSFDRKLPAEKKYSKPIFNQMPDYRIYKSELPKDRAETVRLMLEYGRFPYEIEIVTTERQIDFEALGLNGQTKKEAYECDVWVQRAYHVDKQWERCALESDQEQKSLQWSILQREYLLPFVDLINEHFRQQKADNLHFVGDGITWADIYIFALFRNWLTDYPTILSSHNRICMFVNQMTKLEPFNEVYKDCEELLIIEDFDNEEDIPDIPLQDNLPEEVLPIPSPSSPSPPPVSADITPNPEPSETLVVDIESSNNPSTTENENNDNEPTLNEDKQDNAEELVEESTEPEPTLIEQEEKPQEEVNVTEKRKMSTLSQKSGPKRVIEKREGWSDEEMEKKGKENKEKISASATKRNSWDQEEGNSAP